MTVYGILPESVRGISGKNSVQMIQKKRKELSRYRNPQSTGSDISLTVSGSMTVEAACIVPLFIMLMLCLLLLFQILLFHTKLQSVMNQTVKNASVISYIYDQVSVQQGEGSEEKKESLWTEIARQIEKADPDFFKNGITAAYLEASVLTGMGSRIFSFIPIRGKQAGLNLLRSEIPDENGMISLVVTYRIHFPFFPGTLCDLQFVQKCSRLPWGSAAKWKPDDEDSENDDPYVYITESGSVYHTSLSCTHLHLSIQSVAPAQIQNLRNKNDERYQACERCKDEIQGYCVYITDYGDRWHNNIQCPGLTRTIRKVRLSEVGNRRICSSCKREN